MQVPVSNCCNRHVLQLVHHNNAACRQGALMQGIFSINPVCAVADVGCVPNCHVPQPVTFVVATPDQFISNSLSCS